MPDTRPAIALLFALVPACLDTTPPPDVGRVAREANVDVVWIDSANVSISGNTLTKNGGTNNVWDAGAISDRSIGGHGFVRFKSNEIDKAKAIGLNHDDTNKHIDDIDYAFYLRSDGNVSVYQNGTLVQGLGGYLTTDLFQIEATPDSVLFKRKRQGETQYTVLRTIDVEAGLAFPLLVDTALRDSGATLVNVVTNEDPKIHVAVQGGFFTGALNCGERDVISIHGSALLQLDVEDPQPQDFEDFADTSPPTVRNSLLAYAANHGIDDPANETRILILDIEGSSNPSDIWGKMVGVPKTPDPYSEEETDDLIRGLINRVIGARLAFPNAKLALYGTLVPDADGQDIDGTTDEQFEYRYEALIHASQGVELPVEVVGLFDDQLFWDRPEPFVDQWKEGLDYLAPVFYVRFGCGIPEGEEEPDCEGGVSTGYNAIGASTSLGITRSSDLSSILPLLPLMSVRIHNGNSDYDGDLLRDLVVPDPDPYDPFAGNLTVEMDAFHAADIPDVVLWVGGGQTQAIVQPNEGPNGDCDTGGDCWTVDDYTCWL